MFEGTRCVGIKAQVNGREQEFRGREVVLSCGAIHSPAHLLRAGIGPVGQLKEMGIPVVMGLEGVGQRLMDHPSIALSSFIRRGARMNAHTRRHIHVGLRYSSGLPGVPRGDMFVAALSKSAWHAVGAQIGPNYTGRSVIVDPLGATLAGLGDAEGIAIADVTRERLQAARKRLPVIAQRQAARAAAAGRSV